MIQKIIDKLISFLPHNYTDEEESNLAKLIKVITEQLTEINNTKELFENAQDIDQATGSYLDLLGKIVGQPRGSMSDERYRTIIKAKIQQNLSGGDINQLYNYLAVILDVPAENLWIHEHPDIEPAHFTIEAEVVDLAAVGIQLQEIYEIVDMLRAAGVRFTAYSRGTFQFAKELTGIFQFSSQPETSETDLNTGFSSVVNYDTFGGKFLSSVDTSDVDKGFADIEQSKGGFFGSVIE